MIPKNGRRSIAVLIAVYSKDDPERFARAMNSVLQQVLPEQVELRILLGIDGELPERLASVVVSFQSKLTQCTSSPANLGLAPTLNSLLKGLTDEELIFRMDADDYSHPERFSRQMAFMDLHPDIDILGTAMLEVDAQGRSRVVRYAPTNSNIRRSIAWRAPVAHPTVCFRRRVFDSVGEYPPDLMNEDIALWFRCLALDLKFANLEEPLYEFRIDDRFWSRRGKDRALVELRAFSDGLRRLEGNTWRQIFPLLRFLFRLMPEWTRRLGYALRADRRAD